MPLTCSILSPPLSSRSSVERWTVPCERSRNSTSRKAPSTANGSAGAAKLAKPSLSTEEVLSFERKGHIQLNGLLTAPEVHQLAKHVDQAISKRQLEALRHRVRVLVSEHEAKACRTVEDAKAALRRAHAEVGFLQFFNLWRHCSPLAAISRDARLTAAAAQLLGVRKLRLYQDCVFVKWPGHAETSWHSDLRMAPFDTNSALTAWIPFRAMKGKSDSGLQFASGSHRDFALPFWREASTADLSSRGYHVTQPCRMEVGDVSFHHGWTLHTAPPQPQQSQLRTALSITYFADGARLLDSSDTSVRKSLHHQEDLESYAGWVGDVVKGDVARHELLPLVYPLQGSPRQTVKPRT
ncbi:hypothetical protein WJX73_002660 [Symbiochloris irregularis]|uniref:Phytanoyl-CoA dioxygenase n=1 Tax=Symbiochloris irregularis TaxID=706552 RepID=A0AAW1NZJ9_9CHLO